MGNKTLLSGSIVKELFELSLPLLAGSILQQLYNTVDALIVGRYLGAAAFASTGVSGTVMNLFIFVLNGFCVGISVLFAQAYGSGNETVFRRTVFTALCVGSFAVMGFSFTALFFLDSLLLLIDTPAELVIYCRQYLHIILAGMICAYLYSLFSSILRSVGDTRAALYFLSLSVAVNTVLDYLMVKAAAMGIRGAAVATVLSQMFSAVCCLAYLKRRYPGLLCGRADAGFYADILKKVFRFGAVSALHQSSLYLGKLLVQGSVNSLGTTGVAAFTAAMRVEGVVSSFGDSGGQAVTIFTSQNYGAGNQKRVKDGMRCGMGILVIMAVMMGSLMYLTAPVCMNLFLGETAGQAFGQGIAYLRIVSCFYILSFTGQAYVGYFRGVGRVLIPLFGTTMHLTVRVILSALMISRLGLAAVAWATGAGWILVVIFQTVMKRRTDNMGDQQIHMEDSV